jgi:hypothetical protein
MKKGMFFLLTLLTGFNAISQDYHCIKADAVYLFYNYYKTRAIAIDSVQDHSGYQTYYNFRVIGEADISWPECLSKEWPSWIGPKTDIYTNGDHYFFNYLLEPILIKTSGNVGDSWVSYNFSDGRFIENTIFQKALVEFLGITDSVKKISFQAKDQNGIPISHSINNKQIWISKNHGLVKALNFKLFPDLNDILEYGVEELTLRGISNPETGIQNLTAKEIYSYELGDEFHLWESWWNSSGAMDNKTILTITGKEWLSEDIVKYTKKRCGRRIYYTNMIEDTTYYYNDTITETINFNNFGMIILDALTENYTEGGDSLYKYYEVTYQDFYEDFGRRTKNTYGGYFSEYPHECIQQLITKKAATNKDYGFLYGYADGLGGPYYEDEWGMYHSGLVYYKKGEVTWGTPFNCDSLLTGYYKNPGDLRVNLYPNPLHDFTRLSIDNPENKAYQFQLFNSMGVLVREYHFKTNDLVIPRENLCNGIYFYLLSDGQKAIHSGKLLIR